MEEISYLKPIMVKMKCDKCGKGYMKRANDTVLLSNPPQYEHICENCAHIETYSKSYPYIEFVDLLLEKK
jgi:hypothetical protein